MPNGTPKNLLEILISYLREQTTCDYSNQEFIKHLINNLQTTRENIVSTPVTITEAIDFIMGCSRIDEFPVHICMDILRKWAKTLECSSAPSDESISQSTVLLNTIIGIFSPDFVAKVNVQLTENIMSLLKLYVSLERQKNNNLTLSVMDFPELESFLNGITAMGRYQLIIRTQNVHFFTCDILIESPTNKRAIILDAANSYQSMDAIEKIKMFCNGNVISPLRRLPTSIQQDIYSCPFFALDHAMQIASFDNNIHNKLTTFCNATLEVDSDDDNYTMFLRDFNKSKLIGVPPELLWNAQTISKIIGPYLENAANNDREKLLNYLHIKSFKTERSENGMISYCIIKQDGTNLERNDSITEVVRDKTFRAVLQVLLPACFYQMCRSAGITDIITQQETGAVKDNVQNNDDDNSESSNP